MPTVEELTLSGVLPHLVLEESGWTATWRALTLHSVFQPVLSITHQRIVGYEALLRAFDPVGLPVTPDVLFASTRTAGEARELDRIARCLHVANFMEQNVEVGWLFLNTRPQVFETGWPQRTFIDELSAHFGLPQERIVIEVLEQPADDESAVASMLDASQPRDFLIAIDDFGTGFSNFDRVWRFRPDIVKLDRSLVARAGKRQGDESLISHLIAMLHQSGTLVLAEGVETDDELMILMQADVDFVQGFWLGQPKGSVQAACARVPALIDSMWRKFAEYERKYAGHRQLGFDGFAEAVLRAAATYATSGDLAEAAQRVFHIPEARRVFVTDAQGEQTAPSISAPNVPPPPQRLAPLLATTRSNWSRRAYFKHALAAPGRVAMMGPHYSLIDGQDCYTAAVTLDRGGKTTILCVDFMPGAPRKPATHGSRKR
ncbi:EAL domain-containing protein [Paraburkholderia sp. BCC1885]|uniref:sensor domain-containing phosphodiesterase n=1 Tax=Paraburkholderia sp. BCC1885 TaxID=2562669 RepID=UPI00118311D9|nr:EAL domain-containing protein [Paraburkholderia sp. BCC1885]